MANMSVKNKVLTGWDDLIREVELNIRVAREKAAKLTKDRKRLEKLRDGGIPWPGPTKATKTA